MFYNSNGRRLTYKELTCVA